MCRCALHKRFETTVVVRFEHTLCSTNNSNESILENWLDCQNWHIHVNNKHDSVTIVRWPLYMCGYYKTRFESHCWLIQVPGNIVHKNTSKNVFFEDGLTAKTCMYKLANMIWHLINNLVPQPVSVPASRFESHCLAIGIKLQCSTNNSNESIFLKGLHFQAYMYKSAIMSCPLVD